MFRTSRSLSKEQGNTTRLLKNMTSHRFSCTRSFGLFGFLSFHACSFVSAQVAYHLLGSLFSTLRVLQQLRRVILLLLMKNMLRHRLQKKNGIPNYHSSDYCCSLSIDFFLRFRSAAKLILTSYAGFCSRPIILIWALRGIRPVSVRGCGDQG